MPKIAQIHEPDWSFDDRQIKWAKMETELVTIAKQQEKYRTAIEDIFVAVKAGEDIEIYPRGGGRIILRPVKDEEA